MTEKHLEVRDLRITFETDTGPVHAVDGLNFSLDKGKTLGIVGESGCGKSVTSMAIMRLLPQPTGQITQGQILFDGIDITKLDPKEMLKIRGDRIAMIFQEPMSALNPVMTVGDQIAETLKLHRSDQSTKERRDAVVELMAKVGIPAPQRRAGQYPHQLSGGMRQRVVIAIALACEPDILIADEPTTALDVTIQAQILELICRLQKELGMSVIFITHDLGVIAQVCDEVLVMYGGRAAEQADVATLFSAPRHPYTQGLLASIPRLDHPSKTPLKTIPGVVPSLAEMPPGCRFQNRCPMAVEVCLDEVPVSSTIGHNHEVRCHRWKDTQL